MKCYLLLRNNKESGPYSLEALKNQGLKPTDLIWVEGQSISWKHPTEMDELQECVVATEYDTLASGKSSLFKTSKGVFVAFPPLSSPNVVLKCQKSYVESVDHATLEIQRLENAHESFVFSRKKNKIFPSGTFSKTHNAVWMGCVMAGLVLTAGLIKKIIETYDASLIKVTTAAMPIHELNKTKGEADAALYQNAITTEVVPVDTVTMKPVAKKTKKINLKKLVLLDANDYQVGLLGGIKNLRLLVTNKSAFILDKIKIELQYLKPNGDVIKTDNLVIKGVAPKSSKSLNVASKNRGVKVAYRITDITSKQNSDYLVHL